MFYKLVDKDQDEHYEMIEFAASLGIDPEDESEKTWKNILSLWKEHRSKVNATSLKEKTVSSPVKDAALSILKDANDTLSAALIVAESTDDVDLARVAIKSALSRIENAMVASVPLSARTSFLKDAKNAITRAQAEMNRQWHHITDEDTVDGRAHTMYSLQTRLKESRKILLDFLGEDNQ